MDSSDVKYDLVIACVGNTELDESILNAAFKKSRMDNCEWRILHIVDKSNPEYSETKVQRLLKKAGVLKAEIIKKQATDVSRGIIEYANELSAEGKKTLLVMGVAKEHMRLPFIGNLVYKKVYRNLKTLNIDIEAISQGKYSKKTRLFSPVFNFNGISGLLEAVLYSAAAFLACLILQIFIPVTATDGQIGVFLFYLTACLIASIRGGIIPGLVAGVLSILSINFFFLSHNITILKMSDGVNLLTFFGVAVAISLIGSRARAYILESRQKEAYLNALISISETLNRPLTENEALSYIHNELEKLFQTDIGFFTPTIMHPNRLMLRYPEKMPKLEALEEEALQTSHKDYTSVGYMTPTISGSKWYFEPMMSINGFKGILAIKLSESPLRHDANIMDILLSFADLSATIIDRIERTQIIEDNRITLEKEKIRTMLLSSVSHDLKTPLASIIGSLDVYHNLGHKLDESAKKALTETAYQEAQRLDSFITNILDMSKLETGSVKFIKEWQQPGVIIDRALDIARTKLKNRKLLHISKNNNYEIEVDTNMLLRAISHLLDNVSKYTNDDSTLEINYGPDETGKFTITLKDTGPGIEEGKLEEIFNKYTRIKKQDSKVAGTGLGLPISRYIIESHGGTIRARNNAPEAGASFDISLPNYREMAKHQSS